MVESSLAAVTPHALEPCGDPDPRDLTRITNGTRMGDSQVSKKETVKFADGTVVPTSELMGDPDHQALAASKAQAKTRDLLDKSLAPVLAAIGKFQTKLIASGKITFEQLQRIKSEIGTDGTIDVEYRHTGSARSGKPSIRFGGTTQSVLKSAGVVEYVLVGKRGKVLQTEPDGAHVCAAVNWPYAGQAAHDADKNHADAGCDRKKCASACHGDNSNRQVFNKRVELGALGWAVKMTDGTKIKMDDTELDSWAEKFGAKKVSAAA